jgi:hypothetical protein
VTAYGTNLVLVAQPPSAPRVSVAGVAATVPDGGVGADAITFLVPAPAAGTTWVPRERERVVVTTPAGTTAQLDDALTIALDRPVLLRLDPAVIALADTADYEQIPIRIYGQFLAAPGAAAGTAGAARVEIVGTSGGSKQTVDATLEEDHLTFMLPQGVGTPDPVTTLSLDVNVARGTAIRGMQALTLSVQSVAAPVLDQLDVDVVQADAGAQLGAVTVRATGSGLTMPAAVAGGAQVAAQGRPLHAQLIDSAGIASSPVDVVPAGDTSVTFKLPADTRAPFAGDDDRSVVLVRGALRSRPRTLILRAIPDPAIVNVKPNPVSADAGASLAERSVTVIGTNLSAPASSDRILSVPTESKVRLRAPDGTERHGLITGTTTTEELTFTLPDAMVMPPTETVHQVIVSRADRQSPPSPLTLLPV